MVEEFNGKSAQNYTYTDLSQTLDWFLGDLRLLFVNQRLAFAKALHERLGGGVAFAASVDVVSTVCDVDLLASFGR
eukprot:COSAG01_NODE_13432_length_1586_cov_2.172831_1_plen_76_part_00